MTKEFEKPIGAVHNAQVMFERLESWYNFKAGDINLVDSAEWQYLKECFNHIVDSINTEEE